MHAQWLDLAADGGRLCVSRTGPTARRGAAAAERPPAAGAAAAHFSGCRGHAAAIPHIRSPAQNRPRHGTAKAQRAPEQGRAGADAREGRGAA